MKKYEREQEFINLYNQTSHFNRRVYDKWDDLNSFGEHEISLMHILKEHIEWAWQNLKTDYCDGELFNKYTSEEEYNSTIEDPLFILEYIEDHDFEASAVQEWADKSMKELYDYIYEIDTQKVDKVCCKLLEKDKEDNSLKFLLNKIQYDTYRKMLGYFEVEDYYRESYLKNIKEFIEDRIQYKDRGYIELY